MHSQQTLCFLNLAGFQGVNCSFDKYIKSVSFSAVFRRLAARLAPKFSASVLRRADTTVGFDGPAEVCWVDAEVSEAPSANSGTAKRVIYIEMLLVVKSINFCEPTFNWFFDIIHYKRIRLQWNEMAFTWLS